MIGADKNPGKADFVVQECLNSGTRALTIFGQPRPPYVSPRYAGYVNPTTRLLNLKLSVVGTRAIQWIDDFRSDDEQEISPKIDKIPKKIPSQEFHGKFPPKSRYLPIA